MFKTIENIKKISLIFFILTGIVHLGSNMFLANDLYAKQAYILSKIMDIPFIITGLIYAASSLRLNITQKDSAHKGLDTFLIITIILVLIGLILINILVPDLKK